MAEILPLNYRLRLVPDLSRFTFDGHVDIRLHLAEPAAELVLNAAELAVKQNSGSSFIRSSAERNVARTSW